MSDAESSGVSTSYYVLAPDDFPQSLFRLVVDSRRRATYAFEWRKYGAPDDSPRRWVRTNRLGKLQLDLEVTLWRVSEPEAVALFPDAFRRAATA